MQNKYEKNKKFKIKIKNNLSYKEESKCIQIKKLSN